MARLFVDLELKTDQLVKLPDEPAHHLLRVLRAQSGDTVTLFNNHGGEYSCRIENADKRTAELRILEFLDLESESPLHITLAQGISRGERMDYTLQKAVEMGVNRIIPIITERTNVKLKADRMEKRLRHWQGIITSACEQCGRNRLPDLAAITSFHSLIANAQYSQTIILDSDGVPGFQNMLAPFPQGILIVAGPEGGFSPEETRSARDHDFSCIRLGPRILRTETAALAAISSLQTLFGDFS